MRRALVWGLAYILLWESFVASAGKGASRLAVRAYTRSVLARATGVGLKLANVSAFFAVTVPIGIAVLWVWFAARGLRRTEVA